MKNINESFASLTGFFEQLQQFMRDCDRMIGSEYKISPHGNNCFPESSQSIDFPSSWYPAYLYRAYEYSDGNTDEGNNKVLLLSIFLRSGEAGGWDIDFSDIGEPLVVATMLKKSETADKLKWTPYMGKAWFWTENQKVNGSWEFEDKSNLSAIRKMKVDQTTKYFESIERLETFAVKLSAIDSTKKLKEEVIEKVGSWFQ